MKFILRLAAIAVIAMFSAGHDPAAAAQLPRTRPATATTAPVAAPSLPLTGNAAADLAGLIKRITIAPAPTTPDEIQGTTCDLTIFSKITLENAIPLLEKCAQAADSGLVAPLITDTQTALTSAKAYNCPTNADGTPTSTACVGNGMAIQCLVPGLALVKAAAGIPPVKDANGVVTTPGVPAGVVTIGEKLDEFIQSGGPSSCKAVVQRIALGLSAAALTP